MKKPNREEYYKRLGDAMTGGSSTSFWVLMFVYIGAAIVLSFTR